MGRWLGKLLARQANPPPGFFASVGGSASGTGSYYDPWDLTTALAGGNPGGSVAGTAGNNVVWLRGGTYVGQFSCSLSGTSSYPITFRGYPGERATIDGNFDNSIPGNYTPTMYMDPNGQYLVVRDIEITNTQVNRMCSPWADQHANLGGKDGDARSEGVDLLANNCKLINCIVHDNGIAIFASSAARHWEINGCLSYYNGYYAPFAEQNEAVSVDLVPAGGTAVALSGTYHAQQTGGTSITISNHINAGDYTLVAVGKNNLNYSTITAYFGTDGNAGDQMTLLVGRDGYSKSVAMFGIKGHVQTANVYVHSNDSNVVRAIAQSFVNVNQNATETLNAVPGTFTVTDGAINAGSHTLTSVTGGFTADMVGSAVDIPGAGGGGATLKTSIATFNSTNSVDILSFDTVWFSVTGQTITVHYGAWFNDQWANQRDGSQLGAVSGTNKTHYDVGGTMTSNTNHMVVDAVNFYCAYSKNVATSGNNTILSGFSMPGAFGNNPLTVMSTATRSGAGTVNMQWGWDMSVNARGHNSYDQSGGHANVVTNAGDNTVTAPSGTWSTKDVGGQITIEGAGVAGARYTTTIASFNSSSSIEVTVAPSTSLGSANASWSFGSIMKGNIFLQAVFYATQFYGSSDACLAGVDASYNLWAQSDLIIGGLSGFRLTDSTIHDNYTYGIGTNIGYEVGDMTNFSLQDNYMKGTNALGITAAHYGDMVIQNNTFIGTNQSPLPTDFPTNTYLASNPVANKIVVIPNDYESNRCHILVYNWEGLTSVDVDISSAVAIGTPIYVMNAQNYYATPVYSGTYGGGTINLPTTAAALPAAAAIGGVGGNPDGMLVPFGSMAPTFAAFIVRAQSTELWR